MLKTGRSVLSSGRSEQKTGFVYGIPLTASKGILGALVLEKKEAASQLSRDEQELLDTLSERIASAIQHSVLYHSAITDPLTNLFSHRHFQLQAEQAVRQARRSNQQVGLIIMDLDNFKEVNDTHGHDLGNTCLVQVSDILRRSFRSSDIIARFGGDEFEVLLPDTSAEGLEKITEKLLENIREHRFPEAGTITASIGAALYPLNATTSLDLFMQADNSLYRAKELGRDRMVKAEHKAAELPPAETGRRDRASKYASPLSPGDEDLSDLTVPFQNMPDFDSIPYAGDLIDGHRVVKFLGRGSLGEVLLVRQPELDREVALKRPLTLHASEEEAQQFEEEARITASLNHPGVIPVYTMGRDSDGRRYYTMKPVSGISLEKVLEERREEKRSTLREYTVNRLAEIIHRTAETLFYAHEHGISHLDITPENIMIGEFGEISVIDWGLSASRISRPGGAVSSDYIIGTGLYKGPEFFEDTQEGLGPHSDVYALGAVLYEILTGRPPYEKETLAESIHALKHEQPEPPEVLNPLAGIDPVLSRLCMNALSPQAKRRSSMKEFADILGRFIRGEREWQVIRFGEQGTELNPDEWVELKGDWKFANGEFVTQARNEHIIMWTRPAPSAYRFVCECWSDDDTELSLIGNGIDPRSIDTSKTGKTNRDIHKGYCFQFGAENNICTKLARNENDVLAISGRSVEPGKKYRLEIEYSEGWLCCYIDNERVFAYRELFPFIGKHIGLYGFEKGSHFRPVEIQRQTTGLTLPAIQVADDLYQYGHYKEALQRYRNIADSRHHRLETHEAALKAGICLNKTGRREDARTMFRSVSGSILEPFALAADALLELDNTHGSNPEKGIAALEQVIADNPGHQVISMVLDKCDALYPFSNRFSEISLQKSLELKARLFTLGSNTLIPPVLAQVRAQVHAADTLLTAGKWKEALDSTVEFRTRITEEQQHVEQFESTLYTAVVANGRDDLLPDSPFDIDQYYPKRTRMWTDNYLFHVAVRTGYTQKFLDTLLSSKREDHVLNNSTSDGYTKRNAVTLCLLAQSKTEQAIHFFKDRANKYSKKGLPFVIFRTGIAMTESGSEELFEQWVEITDSFKKHDFSHITGFLKSRFLLEQRDFQGATSILEHTEFDFLKFGYSFQTVFTIKAFLHDLGFLECSKKELTEAAHRHLAGPDLDLFRICMEGKKAEPGPLWPHPLYRPELRLWLALWLEAKGEKEKARNIVLPCVDKRYGATNSQPAIGKLLARI